MAPDWNRANMMLLKICLALSVVSFIFAVFMLTTMM